MELEIKYAIEGFPRYFFDEEFNLYYSYDKKNFRPKKLCRKRTSYGFKINHEFYSRTGLKKKIYPFVKPQEED